MLKHSTPVPPEYYRALLACDVRTDSCGRAGISWPAVGCAAAGAPSSDIVGLLFVVW
jgi:hypothetical protein